MQDKDRLPGCPPRPTVHAHMHTRPAPALASLARAGSLGSKPEQGWRKTPSQCGVMGSYTFSRMGNPSPAHAAPVAPRVPSVPPGSVRRSLEHPSHFIDFTAAPLFCRLKAR